MATLRKRLFGLAIIATIIGALVITTSAFISSSSPTVIPIAVACAFYLFAAVFLTARRAIQQFGEPYKRRAIK